MADVLIGTVVNYVLAVDSNNAPVIRPALVIGESRLPLLTLFLAVFVDPEMDVLYIDPPEKGKTPIIRRWVSKDAIDFRQHSWHK